MLAQSKSVLHFLAAYLFIGAVTAAAWIPFHTNPPARWGDLYLLAVALICARYSWRAAALLFAAAYALVLAMIWPMPADRVFGMAIFAITGTVIITVVERARAHGAEHVHERSASQR